MNKIERVQAVLDGREPDHLPISFWYHFGPEKEAGEAAVAAHLQHFEEFDLDFLKVMNENQYPRPASLVVRSLDDLKKIPSCSGEEPPFAKQLELIRRLRSEIGRDVFMTTTIFSPWTVLRKLTAPETDSHSPPVMSYTNDPRDVTLRHLLIQDRGAVSETLQLIALVLRNFAQRCLQAGADGIFLSVRDDWVDNEENGAGTYDQVVRTADRIIFEGIVAAKFNLLHVCGNPVNFRAFANYPFHAINWADRSVAPSIKDTANWLKPAICGGVDNLKTLAQGSPAECRAQVADAVHQAAPRPIIISPGCTYDPQAVPKANLHAICEAARMSY